MHDRISTSSFITATAACSTFRSVTPTDWPIPGSSPLWKRGDSYDNALAETIFGLYKTEVIRRRGPWRNLEEVEYATLEWVDWFHHRRLFEPIGNIPPVEFEQLYYQCQETNGVL